METRWSRGARRNTESEWARMVQFTDDTVRRTYIALSGYAPHKNLCILYEIGLVAAMRKWRVKV